MNKITVEDKFALVDEEWTPKVIAETNGQLVKLAKGSGELVWHSHENEDELFLVFKGKLTLKLRDKDIELSLGDMFVVPRALNTVPLRNRIPIS